MAIGRSRAGVYSIGNLDECVEVFRKILLPAAALRFYRSRSSVPRELDFHKEQCVEIIREAEIPEQLRIKLIFDLERDYEKVLSWAEVKNA